MNELTRFNVISSRIRLARNVEGLPFPRSGKSGSPQKMLELIKGAAKAAEGLFDCDLFLMSRLSKAQKTALVERHIISLALANNTQTGAVLIERGSESLSIMLNEEDHIREQCVTDGFDLIGAYAKISRYDNGLLQVLPIAFDKKLGFLTACPTNLGTGMRASTMLFLPALKLAGAIEDALKTFIRDYGLTFRGVYGEGSAAVGDTYQLSNSRTLGVDEDTIIGKISRATEEICYCEQRAVEKLAREKGEELYRRIVKSYSVLKNVRSISSSELMSQISDVKLGVILGIVPLSNTKILDEMALLCSPASFSVKIGQCPPRERDVIRANFVRSILAEE